MFFSVKQFQQWANQHSSRIRDIRVTYGTDSYSSNFVPIIPYTERASFKPLTVKECSKLLRSVKAAIVDRDVDRYPMLYKWYRPWDVVPTLQKWRSPRGDFGVGVEVEMGFRNRDAARTVANHIKNWRHVALDWEGGHDPIEATFAPIRYSKLSRTSQVIRYVKYLSTLGNLVVRHTSDSIVGTHINVSVGSYPELSTFWTRLRTINDEIQDLSSGRDRYGYSSRTPSREAIKYFGRVPYGFGNLDSGRFVEWKLFNSQLDPKRLMQYIDIAVALTNLMVTSSIEINRESVLATLEEGYNKRLPKKVKKTAVTVPNADDELLAALAA